MTSPLHALHYADRCLCRSVRICENEQIARDTFRLRVDCSEIARSIAPGQFVMVRLTNCSDPLIGRPLALYDVIYSPSATAEQVDLVYLVKGKLTSRLAEYTSGQKLEIWGPLGNGFSTTPTETLVMVAGGIGYTPFLSLAKEAIGAATFGNQRRNRYAGRVIFCYGARTAAYLAGIAQFEQTGVDVRLATDDGSQGRHGMVTSLLEGVLDEFPQNSRIVCCGPELMMEAVSHIALQADVPCEVSLETPMACGIGICFSCVARVREADSKWDYKRTCVDGPVFDSRQIVW